MEYRSNITEYGGAIFLSSSDSIEFYGDARFIDNTAGQNGGALLIDTSSEVNFYGNTTFKKKIMQKAMEEQFHST